MYNTRTICFFILIFVFAWSCKDEIEGTTTPIRSLSAHESQIVSSTNSFTFDLMTEIEKKFPDENYFISSFSISTALSMLINGASETSQKGFIQVLGLEGMSPQTINESYKVLVEYIYGLDPAVSLNVANSNWYYNKYTINNTFANTISTYYNAEIFGRDFRNSETLNALNKWVEDETKGKIKNILDRINPLDVMFLINAIYFKANWTHQFDPDATANLPFRLKNGQSVDVPTMTSEVKHWWSHDQTLNAQVIEIPYGNESYGFTIIMPDDVSEMDNIISRMNANQLQTILAESTILTRGLYLPKFQLDFRDDLLGILENMGMPLSGLDNLFIEKLQLEVSKVIHQSFLEVNEEGSEAAAATVVGIELVSLPAVTRVNKPFVFLIRERNSGTILFSGKLLDPN